MKLMVYETDRHKRHWEHLKSTKVSCLRFRVYKHTSKLARSNKEVWHKDVYQAVIIDFSCQIGIVGTEFKKNKFTNVHTYSNKGSRPIVELFMVHNTTTICGINQWFSSLFVFHCYCVQSAKMPMCQWFRFALTWWMLAYIQITLIICDLIIDKIPSLLIMCYTIVIRCLLAHFHRTLVMYHGHASSNTGRERGFSPNW
jgi:hypothetical protein